MATKDDFMLHGGGDHARVIVDTLMDQGIPITGIFDPKYTGNLFGVPALGIYDPAILPTGKIVVAIGDNRIRKKVVGSTKHKFFNVVHSSAILSSHATVGTGTMILHRAIVQTSSKIGNHVIVNTAAQIDHDCTVGDYVHIAPGAILCGSVNVGEGAFVGAGATIIPRVNIGRWTTIGAGSVVISDVPDGAVVAGNPARVINHKLA
jgi:sugar O-acyltransferase (sialic acid O-acetyltransferase NeuD family)